MVFNNISKIDNVCPHCGYITDQIGHLTDKKLPRKGDMSFCIKCGNASEFGADLKLVKCNLEELPFDVREELTRVRIAWKITKTKEEEEEWNKI